MLYHTFKKLLVIAFIISYIILLCNYIKVNTQYTMYKEFTEKGIKINNTCNSLPPLENIK